MQKSGISAIQQNAVREQWSADSSNFRIEIKPEAVDQIKSEVIRGLKSLPKRGTEVGGILFGSLVQNNNGFDIEIEHVLAVATEYRFGPTFRLSEVDEKAFSRAIAAWPDRTPIGWYRSNTRTTRNAVPDDEAITAAHFSGTSLYLMLLPDLTGDIKAIAHVGHADPHHFDFGRFSFLDQLLKNADEEIDPEMVPATIFDTQGRLQSTSVVPAASPLVPAHVSGLALSKRAIAASIIGVLGLGAAGWFAYRTNSTGAVTSKPVNAQPAIAALGRPTDPVPASTGLDLRAEYQGRSLMVRWNKELAAIASASGADFTLQQGLSTRTVKLDVPTLLSGGLMLQPSSSDLALRLAVHTPQGDTTQILKVVGLPRSSSAPDAGAKAANTLQSAATASVTTSPTAPVSSPATVVQKAQAVTREPEPALGWEPIQRSTPQTASVPLVVNSIPLPSPATQVAAPPNPVPSPVIPKLSPPQPSSIPPASQTVAPVSSPDREPARISPSPILPKPIYKVQPTAPANIDALKNSGYGDAAAGQVIEVEVSINERGLVTDAHVVKSSGAFARLFEKNTLTAARQWRFEPARIGTQAVPAKSILTFQFAPRFR